MQFLKRSKPRTKIFMRSMVRRDFPEVIAIHNAACPVTWCGCGCDLADILRVRGSVGVVAEGCDATSWGPIVGYSIYFLMGGHIELDHFAVDPARHRRGIGHEMMVRLKGKLSDDGPYRHIELQCRESSLGALAFYKAEGFRAIRLLPGYYKTAAEDGILMRFDAAKF